MTFLGYAFLFGLMLCASTLANLFSYKRGYQKGLQDGEKAFWERTEQEVDEVRREIWQEEPKTGRWL